MRVRSFVEVSNSSSVEPNTQEKRPKRIKVKLSVFSSPSSRYFLGLRAPWRAAVDGDRESEEPVHFSFLSACFYLPPPSLLFPPPPLHKTKQIHPSMYARSPLHLDSSTVSKNAERRRVFLPCVPGWLRALRRASPAAPADKQEISLNYERRGGPVFPSWASHYPPLGSPPSLMLPTLLVSFLHLSLLLSTVLARDSTRVTWFLEVITTLLLLMSLICILTEERFVVSSIC